MSKSDTEWKVNGMTIRLNDGKRFVVVETDKTYDTYGQAVEAIERKIKDDARTESRKLNIPVIAEDMRRTVVVGIHGGTGKLLIKPKLEEVRFGNQPKLYVDAPMIVEAISRLVEANKLRDRLDSLLSKFEIEQRLYKISYGNIDAADHPAFVDLLERESAKRLRLAQSTTLDAELAKVKDKD